MMREHLADLFAVPGYPTAAGAKEETTSREAAKEIEKTGRAALLRHKVTRWFRKGKTGTADEVAEALKEDILSIRPRVSELHMKGKIEHTGERRKSSHGRTSHVWRWVK